MNNENLREARFVRGAAALLAFAWSIGSGQPAQADDTAASTNLEITLPSMIPGLNSDGTIETRLGPGYGGSVKIAAADLVNLTTSELVRERTASNALREALTAYWESWYATVAVDIERRSREIAKSQSEEAAARIATGSLAPVELLTFETQLASRTEDVVNTETEQRRRAADLARVLGMAERADLVVGLDAPSEARTFEGNLRDDAVAASPELRVLASEIKLASVRSETAGDNYRPRLDLNAYVQAQGLGYDDVSAALKQLSRREAVSGYVGLTFELPLDGTQYHAERSRALLAIESARYKWKEGQQQVLADLEKAVQAEISARRRVELAGQTRTIATKRAEGERKRFETGSSTAVQVLQGEDAVRGAELRTARAQADLAEAHISVSYLAGRLLKEVASDIALTGGSCSSPLSPAREEISDRK